MGRPLQITPETASGPGENFSKPDEKIKAKTWKTNPIGITEVTPLISLPAHTANKIGWSG